MIIEVNGKRRRVGPAMLMALEYVAGHPGTPKLHAANYCAPYAWTSQPGTGYGYVNRAMSAGLVNGTWLGHRWSLTATGLGLATLAKAGS